MREGFDREYQQAERQRIQHAVAPVQTPPDDPDRVLRQKPIAEHESNDADRYVDGKEPVPRCNRQYSRRKRRAGHRRHGHDRRVDAQSSRQPVARINDTYDRRIDAGNGCGAHALDYAAEDQRRERSGQRTAQRSERKEHQTGYIYAAVTDDVAQIREYEQRHDYGQLVAVDSPHRIGRRHAHLGREGGQRHVDYRTAYDRGRHAERNGHYRPQPPRHVESVPLTVSRNRFAHIPVIDYPTDVIGVKTISLRGGRRISKNPNAYRRTRRRSVRCVPTRERPISS